MEELVSQIGDFDGPVIAITSPADRSEYSTVVRGSGTELVSGPATLTVWARDWIPLPYH